MNTPSITPVQLKDILVKLAKMYTEDVASGLFSESHYEHVESEGVLFKVGYRLDEGQEPISIRVVKKAG